MSDARNGPEGLDALIAALLIFRKYGNPYTPTICEHDILTIGEIGPEDVSPEDIAALERLGFWVDDDEECFRSTRFGS